MMQVFTTNSMLWLTLPGRKPHDLPQNANVTAPTKNKNDTA